MRRCRACAPPARTAVWVAACSRRRTAQAARRSRAIRITRRISAGSAPRVRRSARRSASARGSSIRCCASTTARSRASTGTWRSTASADGFKRIIERDGPDAVAFYLSGQLLTEDYYVANKLMKGFIGSANVDTNSRLCMASSVAGHKPRVRRRHRAGALRGSRPGRPDRARRLECRVVSSGPVPAHAGEPARARREARGDRSAPHRDRRGGRPASRRSSPAWTPRCSADCWCGSRTATRSIAAMSRSTPTGFEAALQRATEIAPDIAAVARTTGLDAARRARLLRPVRRNARASSPAIRRA